jgi:hypothetical protein
MSDSAIAPPAKRPRSQSTSPKPDQGESSDEGDIGSFALVLALFGSALADAPDVHTGPMPEPEGGDDDGDEEAGPMPPADGGKKKKKRKGMNERPSLLRLRLALTEEKQS